MNIIWTTFAIRLLIAFFLAVGIGIERQWLKSRAVLKTNVLVTLGSAMFVMLSIMTPGDASSTRIAAQIVSGVGFLGGGVILREGASIKGTNTAATIWCAAAIGALVGSGFFVPAYLSTLAVIGANLLSKPLEEAFKKQRRHDHLSIAAKSIEESEKVDTKGDKEFTEVLDSALVKSYDYCYCCDLLCCCETETQVFELISQFASKHNLNLVKMQSKTILSQTQPGKLESEIKINLTGKGKALELSDSQEIMLLLKTEAKANSVSWQLQPFSLV